MELKIRKGEAADLQAVADIYRRIHEQESKGEVTIGWNPDTYPTPATAEEGLADGNLFVATIDDVVVASAIINREQPSAYSEVEWTIKADDDRIGVLHTLTVHPDYGHRGIGKSFVKFFEDHCRELGYEVVRLDTQVKNTRPFSMYPKLGYRLAGIRITRFEDLPDEVELAMFEKRLPPYRQQQ